MTRTAPAHYTRLSVLLHWGMLVLMAATYAAIELRTFFPRGSDIREGFKTWHFMLGLTVLLLVIVRVAARLRSTAPAISPTPPALQKFAARAVHLALYGLMIGMPLLGWTILSASGTTVPFFGLALPPLVAPDKAFADWVKEIHETAGTVGYWLIGLHAAASLFHHYVMKDDTLTRMGWRR